MVQSTLPIEARLLAGQVEDRLAEWVRRDPANPRFETRHAGEMALRLLGDLIENLTVLYAELRREVDDYAARFRP